MLRIHHRGRLTIEHVKWYVNGEVTEMGRKWDVDFMSYMDMEGLIKSHGHIDMKNLWYWNHIFNFSHSPRPLNNDNNVLQFAKDVA